MLIIRADLRVYLFHLAQRLLSLELPSEMAFLQEGQNLSLEPSWKRFPTYLLSSRSFL